MASRLFPPPAAGYPQSLFGARVPKQSLHGSGVGLFGDGTYSGNIVQGGVTLQPQAYNLAGVGVLIDCIVVTGAATIAPNAETISAMAMGHNLVVIGAGASLTASTNAKGLALLFDGAIYEADGGKIHADKIGKAGNFGNLTAYDLAPAALKLKISQTKHAAYVVLGEGAAGAARTYNSASAWHAGAPGAAAAAMQTGGGGSGGANDQSTASSTGAGGKGGPCSGGASSGSYSSSGGPLSGGDAGPYGGPGGAVAPGAGAGGVGGQGDPVGVSTGGNPAPNTPGAGGGLVMLYSPVVCLLSSGCVISADGAAGVAQTSYAGGFSTGSGAAGGGCIVIVTKPGGYTNAGTVRAAGGIGGYPGATAPGGAGGAGSVNIFQNAA